MAVAGMLGCGEDYRPEDTKNYTVAKEFSSGHGRTVFRFTEESQRHFDDLVHLSHIVGRTVDGNERDLAGLLYAMDADSDRNIGPHEIWPLLKCLRDQYLGGKLRDVCPSYGTAGAEEKKADCQPAQQK